jgi:hypothetical protein
MKTPILAICLALEMPGALTATEPQTSRAQSPDVKDIKAYCLGVELEHWRTERTQASWDWSFSGLGDRTLSRDTFPYPIFLEPDTILAGRSDSLVWYHRNRKNEHSVWGDTLKVQGLEDFMGHSSDPLLDLTFGALARGDGMICKSPTALHTAVPTQVIDVTAFRPSIPHLSFAHLSFAHLSFA